jgi:hypothetical protein
MLLSVLSGLFPTSCFVTSASLRLLENTFAPAQHQSQIFLLSLLNVRIEEFIV